MTKNYTEDSWEDKYDAFAEKQLIIFRYGEGIKEEKYLNEIWAEADTNIKDFIRTTLAEHDAGLSKTIRMMLASHEDSDTTYEDNIYDEALENVLALFSPEKEEGN